MEKKKRKYFQKLPQKPLIGTGGRDIAFVPAAVY